MGNAAGGISPGTVLRCQRSKLRSAIVEFQSHRGLCGRAGTHRLPGCGPKSPRISLEALDGQWAAKPITLISATPCAGQKIPLGFGFDTLSDYPQAQTLAQSDNRLRNGRIIGIDQNITHERPVDLQVVQRQLLQVREGGVACAKIVLREAHASRLQNEHLVDRLIKICHEQALGEFQFESIGVYAGPTQYVQYV